MNTVKDSSSTPEERLSAEEFSRVVYGGAVSTVFDPNEGLFKVTYLERCWDEVYDPVWEKECVSNSEKHIEFLVEVWYRVNPDRSWSCIKGKRESLQEYLVTTKFCKEGREFVQVKFTEERLLNGSKIIENFNYENDEPTWRPAN